MNKIHFLNEKAFELNRAYFEEKGYTFQETETGYEFVPMEWKVSEQIALREALSRDLVRRMHE